MAVNSAPEDSVGYFCAVSRAGARGRVARCARRTPAETRAHAHARDDRRQAAGNRVLNDVLFSHHSPAATTRYRIRLQRPRRGAQVERRVDRDRSRFDRGDPFGRRARAADRHPSELQFVVREPYPLGRKPYRLLKGRDPRGERLELQSHMRAGRLYFDGPHVWRAVDIGSRLSFDRSRRAAAAARLPRRPAHAFLTARRGVLRSGGVPVAFRAALAALDPCWLACIRCSASCL